MGKVTLDAALRAKLNGLTQELELYDEDGRLVAYCLPPEVYRRLTAVPPDADFTDDEIAHALRQTGGRPLADIWKDLGRS
jgi:hypothetical protein